MDRTIDINRKSVASCVLNKLRFIVTFYATRPMTRFTYCISCYFREGVIFVNFASQNFVKTSTSIYVYL